MDADLEQQQNSAMRRKPGPRSPHGKRQAKYNALKTGIFAKVVLTGKSFGERRDDFETLVNDLRQSIGPRDQFEGMLVESLALEFLKLARAYQADAEVAPLLFRNVREKFENDATEEAVSALVDGQRATDGKLPAADLLMRYESGIWRQIDRIMDRVQRWRRVADGAPARREEPEHQE